MGEEEEIMVPDELRKRVLASLEGYTQNGGELKRGNPKQCLLGVIGRKVDGDYFKAAMTVLGVEAGVAGALEAGFEDWSGISKDGYPEEWQIGADIAASFLKQSK